LLAKFSEENQIAGLPNLVRAPAAKSQELHANSQLREAVMANLQTLMEKRIAQEIERSSIVDVYDLARKVHAEFPHQTVQEIARLVASAVVARGGNAYWDNESSQSSDSLERKSA
jgi:hypothetical protein